MKILVSGYCGHMGREVVALAEDGYCGAHVVCGVDVNATGCEAHPVYKCFDNVTEDVDCIIDFSHHTATAALLCFAVSRKIPLVLATTGHTPDERAAIVSAAQQIPLFFAANYSLGIAVLIELAKATAKAFPDAEIEIIEKHHSRKLDAPSGTALAIADAICEVRPDATVTKGRAGYGKRTREEIGVHAIRMGNIVGEHEVIIGTPNQTLTLKHEAHSRALFAEGALTAARFVLDMPLGLYDMPRMLSAINERE